MSNTDLSHENFINVNNFIFNTLNSSSNDLKKKILSELEAKKTFIPILNPAHFKMFNIYGLGAVGSWFFRLLSKPLILGQMFDYNKKKQFSIVIKDFDRVEPHNILAQDFFINNIGYKKTKMVNDVFDHEYFEETNQLIFTNDDEFLDTYRLLGSYLLFNKAFAFNYLFVDSMRARLEIFNNLYSHYENMEDMKIPFFNFLIDTRISGQTVHIYCIDLNNNADVEFYKNSLYEDVVANQDTCSLAPHLETGIFAANMAMKFTNHIILNSDEPFIDYSRFKEFNLNLMVL